MRVKTAICGLMSLVVASSSAMALTLTLQEGTGGYSGSEDSYVINGFYDDNTGNYSECPQAVVGADHYNPT